MKVNECPICKAPVIHVSASDGCMGGQFDEDLPIGWSLSVECVEHGWQNKGWGWSEDEILRAKDEIIAYAKARGGE